MEEPTKETVIIVHGTWAAPDPESRRWYQRRDGLPASEGFIAKLDAALQERGSLARCWSHCPQGNQIFQWSGENSWIARTRAASALGEYVTKLQTEGWCCHIVAHSHGGNVVVEALPQFTTNKPSNVSSGKIVTLGTPFINTMLSISTRVRRVRVILNAISWIAFIAFLPMSALLVLGVVITFGIEGSAIDPFGIPYLVATLTGLVLPIVLLSYRLFWRKNRSVEPTFNEARHMQPQFLAVGSRLDEAWQILHHMRSIENPLAVRTNLPRYLFSAARSKISRRVQVARIYGARSFRDLGIAAKCALFATYLMFAFFIVQSAYMAFTKPIALTVWLIRVAFWFGFVLFFTRMLGAHFYSAFMSPFRWCSYPLRSIAGSFTEIGTYVVRSRGWSVLVAMAMGLEGYPHRLPHIRQYPDGVAENFVKYEDMPPGAVQRALVMRSAWINRHFGRAGETFSEIVVTAADMASLLRTIEADQSLVHAAYYTDDECIARIADWIAGRG
jgi:hypothetical protein